ncbi:unnamed protein product [Calypogeia fissa]
MNFRTCLLIMMAMVVTYLEMACSFPPVSDPASDPYFFSPYLVSESSISCNSAPKLTFRSRSVSNHFKLQFNGYPPPFKDQELYDCDHGPKIVSIGEDATFKACLLTKNVQEGAKPTINAAMANIATAGIMDKCCMLWFGSNDVDSCHGGSLTIRWRAPLDGPLDGGESSKDGGGSKAGGSKESTKPTPSHKPRPEYEASFRIDPYCSSLKCASETDPEQRRQFSVSDFLPGENKAANFLLKQWTVDSAHPEIVIYTNSEIVVKLGSEHKPTTVALDQALPAVMQIYYACCKGSEGYGPMCRGGQAEFELQPIVGVALGGSSSSSSSSGGVKATVSIYSSSSSRKRKRGGGGEPSAPNIPHKKRTPGAGGRASGEDSGTGVTGKGGAPTGKGQGKAIH